MGETKHKVFISYHHENDEDYKEKLLDLNEEHDIFLDWSVDTDDIDDELDDEQIREIIRDDYLRESTVTVLLVGTETKGRKHVDWELFSSMINSKKNKKSGILVINLPTVNCEYFTAAHDGEKETVYPDQNNWMSIDSRAEYERRYPDMPARIIDNLLKAEAKMSIVNWSRIKDEPDALSFLIDATYEDKGKCEYDLSRPMRRRNS